MSIPYHINTNQLNDASFLALQTLITRAVEGRIAPAISLAIVQQDDIIFDGAWGYLNPDDATGEVTPAHYFDLASVTKLYTTVALLSLLTAQEMSLQTPLVDIIPEFGTVSPRPIDGGQNPHTKQRETAIADYAGQMVDPSAITLFHLLTHTSGLPPWRDVYNVAAAPLPPSDTDPVSQNQRWQRAVDRLVSYPFVAPPETGIRYSDIGLMLLGEAVARLSGQSLDGAIANFVSMDVTFNPMKNGIQRQQIVPTEIDNTWRKRRVWGEVHDENACGVGGIAGHAGLFATAHMVADFGRRWLAHDFAISDTLYQSAIEVQAQADNDVRGLGWMLRSPDNSSSGDLFSANSYGHTGFTGTSLWIDPERQLAVALMTNRVYDGRKKVGIHALRRAVHDAVIQAVDS